MKTVVATDMVWMRRALKAGPPYPAMNLLLVGNEENGESEPYGTPHVLEDLRQESGWAPEFMTLGERTGEKGDELFGEICVANRGVVRARIVARGEREHTGMGGASRDMSERLIEARGDLQRILGEALTLKAGDGWVTGMRFPFMTCGESGIYNITPSEGVLGIEVRPIPEDSAEDLLSTLHAYCGERGLDLEMEVTEGGVACPMGNRHLGHLIDAARRVSGARAQDRQEAGRHLGALRPRRQRRRLGPERHRPPQQARAALHPQHRAVSRRAAGVREGNREQVAGSRQ